ncbi:hypothetical protein pb186bvf_000589 [Paramecium bursaria]
MHHRKVNPKIYQLENAYLFNNIMITDHSFNMIQYKYSKCINFKIVLIFVIKMNTKIRKLSQKNHQPTLIEHIPTNQSDRNYAYRSPLSQTIVKLRTIVINPSFTNLNMNDDEEIIFKEHQKDSTIKRGISLNEIAKEEMGRFIVEWHWKFFFEFLFYHIIFFIFLGPFMVILFFKYPGMPLLINMRFIKHHPQFYFQFLLWLGSIIGGMSYFWFQDSIITLTEVVFMWFALLIRAVVIAAKYATLSEERITLYKQEVLSEEVFNFDLMMWDWRLQTPKVLFLEPLRSMRRHDFDPEGFWMDFLAEPNKNTLEQIKNTKIGFYKEYYVGQSEIHDIDEEEEITGLIQPLLDGRFNGFHVFGYIINKYQSIQTPGSFSNYCVIQALIMSMTPILLRIYDFQRISLSWLDMLRLIINVLTSFQAFFGAFVFLQIGLYDLQRKFFILDQCLYMLKLKKKRYPSSRKLLPTINFNNPRSLQAWSMMRTLGFDYGKTYDFRIQGFYSLIFIGWGVLFIILLTYILGFIEFTIFQLVLLGEMLGLLTGFNAYYLYHGAKLNQYYDDFDIVLEDIKSLYISIQRKKEDYFQNLIPPTNPVHKKFVNLLMKGQTGRVNLEAVSEYIDLLLAEIDDTIRHLQYDIKHNPFQAYGITISFNFLKSLGVAIFTILGYVIQQTLSGPSASYF